MSQTHVNSFQIRPVVEKIYPLEELKSAFQKLSEGGARGKLVVEF